MNPLPKPTDVRPLSSVGTPTFSELEAALAELDPTDRNDAREWLREAAEDADFDEPEVGIFANPRMAHFFRTVACLLEDQVSA